MESKKQNEIETLEGRIVSMLDDVLKDDDVISNSSPIPSPSFSRRTFVNKMGPKDFALVPNAPVIMLNDVTVCEQPSNFTESVNFARRSYKKPIKTIKNFKSSQSVNNPNIVTGKYLNLNFHKDNYNQNDLSTTSSNSR